MLVSLIETASLSTCAIPQRMVILWLLWSMTPQPLRHIIKRMDITDFSQKTTRWSLLSWTKSKSWAKFTVFFVYIIKSVSMDNDFHQNNKTKNKTMVERFYFWPLSYQQIFITVLRLRLNSFLQRMCIYGFSIAPNPF